VKLLLHTCCAVCLAGVSEALADDVEPLALFYNPNIHPLIEFRKRLKAFRVYLDRMAAHGAALAAIIDDNYGLERFLDGVPPKKKDRCARCYHMRLVRAAEEGVRAGADAFATTLTVSPHQDHDLIRQVGDDISRAHGIPFFYRDWRPTHDAGMEKARRMSLYRQQYCGCIFSEWERYRGTSKELYRDKGRRQPSAIGG